MDVYDLIKLCLNIISLNILLFLKNFFDGAIKLNHLLVYNENQ